MRHRRLSIPVAVVVTALSCSTAALAAVHPHKVSGRVVSINVKRHTLKLRETHAAKAGTAAAHAAAAVGPVVVVAFGKATVTGPNGAVAVGDDVTVTTQTGSGPAVASAIRVIGQPNGGVAGKGAAVPGVVTALDAANAQLTLAVVTTNAQGQAQPSSVIVTVGSSTILAVSDTNGDNAVTLGDVAVGDHVVVFTADATANPMAAVGILDASNAGANHENGGDGPQRISIPGTVVSVDATGSTLVITPVADGNIAGPPITVTVTPQTSFGGKGGDGSFGLNDINAGDNVVVYAVAAPANGAAVALGVVNESSRGGSGSNGSGGSGSNGSGGSSSHGSGGSDSTGSGGSDSSGSGGSGSDG
jgi:hypothetical protein